MPDPHFPGFAGEDDQPAAKPPPPPAPAPRPAFDAFAGVKVQTAAPGAPPAPGAAPTPGAPPPPPLPSAQSDDGVKPSVRRDLWTCPHCTAGNKPDRTTCRLCGKSPQDPVVIPLHRRTPVRIGAVAGAVVLAIVLFLALRTDLSLRPAALAQVDVRPRIGGSATGTIELGGNVRFAAERRISVCGRVAAVGTGPLRCTLIALALGPTAADERPAVTKRGDAFDLPGGVVLAVVGEEVPRVEVGALLSVVGTTGPLLRDASFAPEGEGLTAIAVQDYAVGP